MALCEQLDLGITKPKDGFSPQQHYSPTELAWSFFELRQKFAGAGFWLVSPISGRFLRVRGVVLGCVCRGGSGLGFQGRPFRSVPGARISVRSGPFRSAAFHVVSELA